MPKKRTPAAERRQEAQGGVPGPSAGCPGDNWPDTSPGGWPGSGADVGRGAFERRCWRTPGPEGKLEAMTGYSFSTPVWDGRAGVRPAIAEVRAIPAGGKAARQANGPEGVPDWDAVNWQLHEGNVRRLRQRIFKAARDQDWAKVRSLQKMMLRSWSNTLVSVRQATQRNAGRRTAGVDGQVALTSGGQGGNGSASAPHDPILGPAAGPARVCAEGQ